MLRPRYVMLGGFLGAGKTTAMLAFARLLKLRGMRVGAITNDQSVGLVDTQVLQAGGHQTQEISGGCFCCKFDSLLEAAQRLTTETQPDVLLAEPVGSCTDLRATVSEPLRQIYGDQVVVAPLSVVVDPIRAARVLGLRSEKQFSSKVVYIYERQLEEADLIVINKTDLLQSDERTALREALQTRWPHKQVLEVGLRSGQGVEAWLEQVLGREMESRPSMMVDYDEYAEGEALLGWLNLAGKLKGAEFDGNQWLFEAAQELQSVLQTSAVDCEIAHLKMTLLPQPGNDLGVVNLVRQNSQPELSYRLAEDLEFGELTVNLRAEADPEWLKSVALEVIGRVAERHALVWSVDQTQAFRPGRPVPIHRLSV